MNVWKNFYLMFLNMLIVFLVQAQSNNEKISEKPINLSLEGMLGFSTTAGVLALNMGALI